MTVEFVVFGDDWGRHPSTTQHLVRALSPGARIVWVNSLGMRTPRISRAELQRAVGKLQARQVRGERFASEAHSPSFRCLEPPVLPFHRQRLVRGINRVQLGRALTQACLELGMRRPYVLAANPVASFYLGGFPHSKIAYLRLDDYPLLPGVDPELALDAEAAMLSQADVAFATASTLIPAQPGRLPWHELPQGVDVAHWTHVSDTPPTSRVLGFFGLLAAWVDYDLIRAVARAKPDWTLELLGPVQTLPEDVRTLPNVRVLPAVPYERLPQAVGHWRAAWLPFVINELTHGVNPLKVREYLAAGLPTFASPLPAVQGITHVTLGTKVDEVTRWLDTEVASDSSAARLARKASMTPDSWQARAAQLCRALQ